MQRKGRTLSGNEKRIYCAGPLFNAKEREEMKELADAFEEAGFATFLPQRDGLEMSVCLDRLAEEGVALDTAAMMVSRAIFALDVFQVIKGCGGVVVNLNGRVPDEGAVSEAAIAWCSGKPLVAYKADSRSLLSGQDNPLVVGLFDFRVCDTMLDAVKAMEHIFNSRSVRGHRAYRSEQIKEYLELGEKIAAAMNAQDKLERVTLVLKNETNLGFSDHAEHHAQTSTHV